MSMAKEAAHAELIYMLSEVAEDLGVKVTRDPSNPLKATIVADAPNPSHVATVDASGETVDYSVSRVGVPSNEPTVQGRWTGNEWHGIWTPVPLSEKASTRFFAECCAKDLMNAERATLFRNS